MAAILEEKEKEAGVAGPSQPAASTLSSRLGKAQAGAERGMSRIRKTLGVPEGGFNSRLNLPKRSQTVAMVGNDQKATPPVASGTIDRTTIGSFPEGVKSKAAPAAPSSAAAPAAAKPKGLVTNLWSPSPMAMKNMGGGNAAQGNATFASGQGQPEAQSMYQWTQNIGKDVQRVMLPTGVNPDQLTPDGLSAFGVQTEQMTGEGGDDGRDVTVIRGLRKFKGGKEIKDDMTDERKMRQGVSSAISDLAMAGDRNVDQGAIGSVITQMGKSQTDERAAAATADATKAKALIDAMKESGTSTKSGSFKLTTRGIAGDTSGVDIPWTSSDGGRTMRYSAPGIAITTYDGILALPKGVKEGSPAAQEMMVLKDTLYAALLEQLKADK